MFIKSVDSSALFCELSLARARATCSKIFCTVCALPMVLVGYFLDANKRMCACVCAKRLYIQMALLLYSRGWRIHNIYKFIIYTINICTIAQTNTFCHIDLINLSIVLFVHRSLSVYVICYTTPTDVAFFSKKKLCVAQIHITIHRICDRIL